MSKLLVHIADRVLNRPLMIHPDKLALISSILEGRIGIDPTEFKDMDIDAAFRDAKPDASRFVGSRVGIDGRSVKPYSVQDGVAIIPVIGSLVNRGAWLGVYSGMTSYEGIGYQLDTAATDPDVKSVLLDIDSPGGEAIGAFETADKVAALARLKRVVAVANGICCSAAYGIASSATEIVATPSSVTGSIGVVLLHADYSKALHQKGIKPTLIHAGAHKVDGNPYEPLTDQVRSDLQAEVNQSYDLFVSSVARGRKGRMTEKVVRATEARTYIGAAALEAGLVDAIGSFQSALADLTKGSRKPSSVSRNSAPGLALQTPAPPLAAAQVLRPAAEQVAILDACQKAGLEKLAAIILEQSPTSFSTEAALELVAIAAKQQIANDYHACGLYLGDASMRVAGGPLFASPAADPKAGLVERSWLGQNPRGDEPQIEANELRGRRCPQ
jgi:signal peptide peptidase SppA